MTRISAILTTYNVESYVATAMQSVIDAGFSDLELIVVDDGSTEATCNAADVVGHAAPSDRVDYVPLFFAKNTIGGVASAANAGLDMATGDVVIFVDGDDWVLPGNLAGAVNKLLSTDDDFVVCDCQEYWNDTAAYTRYPEGHLWAKVKETAEIDLRRKLLLQMAPFPWRKIYPRSFLESKNLRFPIGDYFFEDNPFHWETSVQARNFCFFEPVTHVHRMARQGQTVTSMGVKPLQIFEHARTISAMLASNKKSRAYEEQYFQWLTDHVLWCCRHVSPQGLNLLFDQARAALQPISDETYWQILSHKPRNLKEVRQMTALRLGDRMGFLQSL